MKTKTLALAALLTIGKGNAATLQLDLNRGLEFSVTTPAGFAPWVKISATETGANQVRFDIQSALVGDEFVSDIALNLSTALDPKDLRLTDWKSTGAFTLPTVSLAPNLLNSGMGARFDMNLFFATSNSSGGNQRFNLSDTVSFTASYTGDKMGFDATSFNVLDHTGLSYAQAHVQAIGECDTSAWIATTGAGKVIPEPSTALIAAAASLILLAKRKRI